MAVISDSVFSGPYTGNGDQAAFPFSFSIVNADDIRVEVDDVPVSSSDYIVTFGPTNGTVSFNVAPANGTQILLVSAPDYLQTSEFENEGAYNLKTVNVINRRMTVRERVLKDGFDRALKVPLGEVGQEIPLMNIPAVIAVGDDLLGPDNIGTVADDLNGADTIGTVAADLTTADTIGTVATNIANVIPVGANIAKVITVANDLLGANTIGIVATNIANVNLTGGSIANVNAVAGSLTAIGNVNTNLAAVNTVSTNIANVNTVGAAITNVNAVGGSIANVNSVAGALTNIGIVAGSIANVNLVGNSIANVNLVGGSIASVNTVAGSIAAVNTVSANMTKVSTVNANIASVVSVANDLALGAGSSYILRAPAAAAMALAQSIAAQAANTAAQAAVAAIALPSPYFATHADAVAAVGGITNGATVGVITDEDQDSYFTSYTKTGGVLVFLAPILAPSYFHRSDMSRAANRGKVIVQTGDSRTQALPATRTAYETILFAVGGPYELALSYNHGANGATLASNVAKILAGDQSEQPYDYLPTNTVPPAPFTQGTTNPWATVNADPDEIWIEFGTNDFRVGFTGSTQATFRTNLGKLVAFYLRLTRAKIRLRIPAPIGYANPDPGGFTDCVSADDAAARSAAMRQCYLDVAKLPSSRIELHDTHKTLYGFRYDTVAAAQDPEGAGALATDTLHNNSLGDTRKFQIEARMFDRSLPARATHYLLPKAITDIQKWGRTFRWKGGGTNFFNIDNYPPRRRGDASLGANLGGATQNGNAGILRAHDWMDQIIHAGNCCDASDLAYRQQCYVYFPVTGITIGPINLNGGTDLPANGQRQFTTVGDFSQTSSGITATDIARAEGALAYIYVTERRYMPGAGETQIPLQIVMQGRGAGPLSAITSTATLTNASNDLVVTANTTKPFRAGDYVDASIAGFVADTYIQSVPVDGTGKPTATGTYKLSANFTGTTTAGVTVTSRPAGVARPERVSGCPFVVRGVNLQRESITGSASIDLYFQTSDVGANGATPYPGVLVGTLTIANGFRSAPIANWTQDATNFPTGTFPKGPKVQPGTYSAFYAVCTSGTLGRWCTVSVLFGDE